VNTIPPLERVHGDNFNTNVKGSATTLKDIARVVKATTREANQIKNHEASISCLYLIN
jgi:hypothetical protein